MPNAAQFARLREEFLKKEFPSFYEKLVQSNQLESHLEEIGLEAESMHAEMFSQMREKAPEEMSERLQYFEGMPLTLREIVQHEVILVPPKG